MILRHQFPNFRRSRSGSWIQSDDSAAQIVLHQSERELLADAQARSHQLVFVIRLFIFPLDVKVCAEARMFNRHASFLAKSSRGVKSEQRHGTTVLHRALRKAQLQRPAKTFLEKWCEARIRWVEPLAL